MVRICRENIYLPFSLIQPLLVGFNNDGNNYECRQSSQNEFAYHFNLPDTDPRHPNYAGVQQQGVYSSYMFHTNAGNPGIHLINLDARYHRSPTILLPDKWQCEGASSTVLGAEQWAWLENELSRPSEIKVIGSGVNVLAPTHRLTYMSKYCAWDGINGTFDAANTELGEDFALNLASTPAEKWAQFPSERLRLLNLVQECVNAGNAKQVVFISGNAHYAEVNVKEIPARSGQPAVTVFEVASSGIDNNQCFERKNANRLHPNDKDDWPAIKSLNYTNGTNVGSGEDPLLINCARANYGGIHVDWDNEEVHLSIYTPYTASNPEEVRVTLDLGLNR